MGQHKSDTVSLTYLDKSSVFLFFISIDLAYNCATCEKYNILGSSCNTKRLNMGQAAHAFKARLEKSEDLSVALM